ncbi:hypothetical protein [Ammoniphilus resinae]|uniref:Uncharacterized protein n=1 Tax=Ammoniphilus resinae TaxID=861532 RepID=A0ABS4GU01_9BACL|nr:hypothetical protein [Ammoniphilus resinae]
MIPFSHTLPYERIGSDLYIHECPFCGSERILLTWRLKDLDGVKERIKKALVMPCCHEKLMIIDADSDYLLADTPIRR